MGFSFVLFKDGRTSLRLPITFTRCIDSYYQEVLLKALSVSEVLIFPCI